MRNTRGGNKKWGQSLWDPHDLIRLNTLMVQLFFKITVCENLRD